MASNDRFRPKAVIRGAADFRVAVGARRRLIYAHGLAVPVVAWRLSIDRVISRRQVVLALGAGALAAPFGGISVPRKQKFFSQCGNREELFGFVSEGHHVPDF